MSSNDVVQLVRCQARPAVARFGFREDALCASAANTVVRFRTREMPVCGMHRAMYERWGDLAEQHAESAWMWFAGSDPDHACSSGGTQEP